MAHTWKHKKDEEALEKFPKVNKRIKRTKMSKKKDYKIQYDLDLGELADEGYDVKGLFKGTSLSNLEKRLEKKKF